MAELRLLGSWWDTPQPYQRRLGHRLWLAREHAGTAIWRVKAAIAGRVATRRMRERAWTAGFALALGGPAHRWLDLIEEYREGNEAGWDIRHEAPAAKLRVVKDRDNA
jgi:hypothetical protein